MSCRQDWHQTSSQVVVTIYGKNPLPTLSSVKANRTVVSGAERAGWGTQCALPLMAPMLMSQGLGGLLVLFNPCLVDSWGRRSQRSLVAGVDPHHRDGGESQLLKGSADC